MFADDLASVLVNGGVATEVFIGTMAQIPVTDGPHISIVETAGAGAEFVQDVPGASMVMPGAQLVVRDADPAAAQTKAWAVWALLVPIRNQFVAGTWYRQIKVLQTPYDMGLDATGGRVRFGFNVIGDKKPS